MKFLHTADWHIGLKAVHVGEVAERVRAERHEMARRVVDLANRQAVDFLAIAGDMFDDNGVARVEVQRAVDILSKCRAPVLIIPGNHDPLGPGSVWEHAAWSHAPGITVCREPQRVELAGGVVFVCPIREKHSTADPTAWIDAAGESQICVGLAHGSLLTIVDDPDFPIPLDAAERSGLDYLALGHYHRSTPPADAQARRIGYPGTPEPTQFETEDRGFAHLVEIAGRGETPQVISHRTAGLTWRKLTWRIESDDDLTRLRSEFDAMDAQRTLIDVRLEGIFRPSQSNELEALDDLVRSRFLFARLDPTGLLPEPTDDAWLDELPGDALREAGRELLRLSDPAETQGREEGQTPEVAAMALRRLYQLMREE